MVLTQAAPGVSRHARGFGQRGTACSNAHPPNKLPERTFCAGPYSCGLLSRRNVASGANVVTKTRCHVLRFGNTWVEPSSREDPEPPTSNIAGRIRIAQSLRANHAMRRSLHVWSWRKGVKIHEWELGTVRAFTLACSSNRFTRSSRARSFVGPAPFDNGLRRIADAQTVTSPGGSVIAGAPRFFRRVL